jgi:hypothetical protein
MAGESQTKLPDILAGPILRYTESQKVCVWIATSSRKQVVGRIYTNASLPPAGTKPKVPPEPIGWGETISLQFGEKLFVALVEINPTAPLPEPKSIPPFPEGVLLAYELELTPISKADAKARKHVELGAVTLQNHPDGTGNQISYGGLSLPTFYIARRGGSTNILHASCRKPHGHGIDALAIMDFILGKYALDLDERPSALFLTGDQIYADDVSDAIFDKALTLSKELLGFDEKISTKSGEKKMSELAKGGRIQHTRNLFTPDDAAAGRNQLFGFGEFAAMYLMCWNLSLFPKIDSSKDPNKPQLEIMQRVLTRVRRALANIPTYMIMDDHEVTDDWNLTPKWQADVLADPTTKRIVANALAAYSVFQAWGNNPKVFTEDFFKPLTAFFGDGGGDASGYETQMLGFHTWSYVAPTSQPVVVLDTRTQRGPSNPTAEEKKLPAELMNEEAVRELGQMIDREVDTRGKILIIVSPAVMFGVPQVEAVQEGKLFYSSTVKNDFERDNESWHANKTGMYRFLLQIYDLAAKPKACVVLSGDLHFSFAVRAEFVADGRSLPFIQFTSSALKNMHFGEKEVINVGYLQYVAWQLKEQLKHNRQAIVKGDKAQPDFWEFVWRRPPEGHTRGPFALGRYDDLELPENRKLREAVPADATLLTYVLSVGEEPLILLPSNIGQLRIPDGASGSKMQLNFFTSIVLDQGLRTITVDLSK